MAIPLEYLTDCHVVLLVWFFLGWMEGIYASVPSPPASTTGNILNALLDNHQMPSNSIAILNA